MTVRFERHGAVGVIEIENPPVNALSGQVRSALLVAIEALDNDSDVGAIVIHGVGKHFVAGADVREFDADPVAPLLNDLLLRLESCGKPVIAALHGSVLGGGAELALASHYRIAARDLKFGFPEIHLGLIPGAGGCVRYPRLVGTRVALEAILAGEPIAFDRARELGVVDRVLEGDFKAGALVYAEELVRAHQAPCRLRDGPTPDAGDPGFGVGLLGKRPRAARAGPAGQAIVDALRAAAESPFLEALATTRTLFEKCRRSTESRALRHLFFAERERPKYEGVAALHVERVGIVGAGTMGTGIAIAFASAGYRVCLVDAKAEVLEAGFARLRSTLERSVRKERMSAEEGLAAVGRVRTATSLDALAESDLVIEAVFERLDLKQSIVAQLARLAPRAILATNTSTLDVDAIAQASGRPADVVGMHFFSPANLMRLVEIVRGRDSSQSALATVAGVARRLGKIGVVVGNAFGFVGNRMLYAYGRERELLMLEGVSPAEVDAALETFGMAMGPNAVGDLAGLDIGYNARREWRNRPSDPRFFRVSDLLVEQGRQGQKTGQGFYRYDHSGQRQPDPAVVDLIRREATRLGVPQRAITAGEIVERCMLALINEGARVLGEGIARSASDIDVVWCNGYGFPRHRGGPMFYADTLGVGQVVAGLRAYATATGDAWWEPAALLVELADSRSSLGTSGRSPAP